MKLAACTVLALSAISIHAQTNGPTTSGAQGAQSSSSASGNTSNGTGSTLQTTVGVGVGNGPQTTSTAVGPTTSGATVDTSNHSTNSQTYEGSKALFLPAVTPPLPPQVVPSASVVTITTACGPRMSVVRDPVIHYQYRMFGKPRETVTGYTYTLVPFQGERIRTEPWTDGTHTGHRRFGTQAVILASVLSSSTGHQIGAAGNGGSFAGGQMGAGSASAVQEQVEHIQILDCELPVELDLQPEPTPVAAPPPEPLPTPTAAPAAPAPVVLHHHHRKHVARCYSYTIEPTEKAGKQ